MNSHRRLWETEILLLWLLTDVTVERLLVSRLASIVVVFAVHFHLVGVVGSELDEAFWTVHTDSLFHFEKQMRQSFETKWSFATTK